MLYEHKLMRRELVIQLLTCISLSLIQFSNGQQCNTMVPANSRTILDSNTLHTINMAGQMIPFAILGWTRIDVDGIVYTVPNIDTLDWRPPTLNTGQCGPEYLACIQGVNTAVNSTLEMNWLVSRYYEIEANVIYIRIKCAALSGSEFATDCRDAFQIFYYQSDQATTITNSLLSQFLPAESNKTVSGVVSAEFTKSKQGFYIGFFNNIPCPALKEILFYYFECPATNTSDLYSLPATLAPNSTEVFVRVNISCPTGSLHQAPLRLVAECYWDGTWRLPVESVCECDAGYYLSVSNANSSMPCVMCRVDTYKGETGNSEECSVCPFRSSTRGMEGSSECLCDMNWYRGEGESVIENCGQSPSAVVNLRVERGDGIVSRVVWDEPLFLGNRSENELRYNVSYYPSLTPSSEKSVGELREAELVLSSGDIADSTEYVFVVTSWNAVSFVSGVFNRANVTVLSSFPTILNISYNESSEYLQWSYELYGEREYVFEISYTNISHGSVSLTLNSGECGCSNNSLCACIVTTPDLDSVQNVSFRLMVNVSGILINTSLSTFFSMLTRTATSTSNPITTSNTTSITTPITNSTISTFSFIFSLPILIGIIVVPIFVILIITLSLCICLIIFLTRKVSVRSKSLTQGLSGTALVNNPKTHSAHTNAVIDVTYQDPRLYLDLNKAIRSLTKELEHFNIKPHCVIGSGEFGEVCKGTLKKNDRDVTVAIKTLKPNSTEKNKEDFFREASAMGQFTHENVIYLYGVTLTKPIMIVTPYMENGSLDKFLVNKKSSLVLNELADICLGVARGMNYLSNRGFVHRDLAARNILIDSDLTAKIADFGLSRETEENFYNVKSGGKIPVRWTAPEAILYRKFNMASDVWSYGVLMWEVMSFGNTPYGDMDNFKLLEEIQQGFRLPQPVICPYSLYTLMARCWDTNQDNRPTFIELEREIHLMIKSNFHPKPRGRVSRHVVEPHSPLNFTSVDDWLTSLKMERYSDNFKANSYTQISSIWHMTEHDLLAIDIIAIGHRNKMMQSIHTANGKLSRTYSVRV